MTNPERREKIEKILRAYHNPSNSELYLERNLSALEALTKPVCDFCGSNDLVCGKAWKEEREKLLAKIEKLKAQPVMTKYE
jgi:hypothetical protein